MLPFGVTIPATVPQGSEIPEGLMNNPVYGNISVFLVGDLTSKVRSKGICNLKVKNVAKISVYAPKYTQVPALRNLETVMNLNRLYQSISQLVSF